MKKVLAVFLLALASCKNKSDANIHYLDLDCKIVGSNSQDGKTNDKFHTPVNCRLWLIQSTLDTTQYAELNSCNISYKIDMSDGNWYNKKVGDTLHFDYIRKDRFFTKK